MKNIVCVILCVLLCVLLLLTGCYQKGTVADTGLYAPYYIADANIPWADKLNAAQFDKVELLEQDGYGRQYFRYITYSVFWGRDIEIHIISQGSEPDRAYYYPECCYLIGDISADTFTAEAIALLKEQNMWNQPLNLTDDRIFTATEEETTVYEQEFKETLLRYLELDGDYTVCFSGLERLSQKQQIFVAQVFLKNQETGERIFEKCYALVYDRGAKNKIAACEEIVFLLNCQDEICRFREMITNP